MSNQSAANNRMRRARLRVLARESDRHGFLETYDKLYCRCEWCSKRKSIWRKAKRNIERQNAEMLALRRQWAFEEAEKEML